MAKSNLTGILGIGVILAGVYLYIRNENQKLEFRADKEGSGGGSSSGVVGDPIPIDDGQTSNTSTSAQDPISTIDPQGRYHTVNNYFDALLPANLGRDAGRATTPQRIAASPTITRDTPAHARGAFAERLNENANFFGSGRIAASRERAQAVIDSYKSRTSSGRTTGTSRNSSRNATRGGGNSQQIPSYYPSGFTSAGDSYGGFN